MVGGTGESGWRWLETAAAWLLALVWLGPLVYAFWAAFHPWIYATRFDLFAPLTLENFYEAWSQAPFARYYLNTFMLVSSILVVQFVVCTLAGYAFARFEFFGRDVAFALVLVQLMIMPEVLIVENYRTMSSLNLVDTIMGIGLPYMASAFGGTGGGGTRGGLLSPTGVMEGLCPVGQADLCRLRPGLGQLPLEQLPLAPGDHQLGGDAAPDGGAGHFRCAGVRRGLVRGHRRDASVRRTVAGRVPLVPAPVRAVLHACGDQVGYGVFGNLEVQSAFKYP
jgi:hypothetical protein